MDLPPLLADVNIATEVVEFLRTSGVDVVSVVDLEMHSASDRRILAHATSSRRFVLTHDSDFGRLAIAEGEPYFGLLYLRPGGVPPREVMGALRRLDSQSIDWSPPMIAVMRGNLLRIRRPAR